MSADPDRLCPSHLCPLAHQSRAAACHALSAGITLRIARQAANTGQERQGQERWAEPQPPAAALGLQGGREVLQKASRRAPGLSVGRGGRVVLLTARLAYDGCAAGGVRKPWRKNFPGKLIWNMELGWLCNASCCSPRLWKSGFRSLCFHGSSMTLGKTRCPSAEPRLCCEGRHGPDMASRGQACP